MHFGEVQKLKGSHVAKTLPQLILTKTGCGAAL